MMKKILLLTILAVTLLVSFSAVNAAVVINEFEPNPDDGCLDCAEWVEIRRTTSSDPTSFVLDAGGQNTSFSFNSEGYLVVTGNLSVFSTMYPNASGTIIEGNISLNNDKDTIIIYNSSNNAVLDNVTYGDFSSKEGQSLGLYYDNLNDHYYSYANPTPTQQNPDVLPPGKPTNINSEVGLSSIKWTWTNPSDETDGSGFKHVEVYLNGVFQENSTLGEFTATGLTRDTIYTIKLIAVDNAGNKAGEVTSQTKTLAQGVYIKSVDLSREVDSERQTVVETSIINNTALEDYSALSYEISNLKWEGKDSYSFESPEFISIRQSPISLASGSSATLVFDVTIPSRSEVEGYGYYKATYRVLEGTTELATESFNLRLLPEDYDNDLEISDIDLDDDELFPGDETTLEIEVDNNFDDDIDDVEVIVLNENLDIDESFDIGSIDEGDDATVSADLQIPYDSEEGDYTLLILVTGEDPDGNDISTYDLIDLSVEKDSHDLVISEIDVSDEEISCGSILYVDVEVTNIGTSDEDDLVIRLKNSELNYEEIETLDELEENEDETFTFEVRLPVDIDSGAYIFNAEIEYDDDEDQDNDNHLRSSVGVTINCGESNARGETGEATLSGDMEKTITQGTNAVFSFELENIGDKDAEYELKVSGYSGWASEVVTEPEGVFIISPGETVPVKIYVYPESDAAGSASLFLKVYSNDEVVISETISLNIVSLRERAETGGEIDYSTIFLVGAIVVGIAALAGIYIFANKNSLLNGRKKREK